jgi:hypothetical protein
MLGWKTDTEFVGSQLKPMAFDGQKGAAWPEAKRRSQ